MSKPDKAPVQSREEQIREAIMTLSKEDFREQIIGKVCRSKGYARILCFGFESLSDDDAKELLDLLSVLELTPPIQKDEILDAIHIIVSRSVTYQ